VVGWPTFRGAKLAYFSTSADTFALEFWLKLKTKKVFAFLDRQVSRLSGRLKAGRIGQTEQKIDK
jgi:hypothetical protein